MVDGNSRRLEIHTKLLRIAGMSAAEVARCRCAIVFNDTIFEVLNLYKKGTPLTLGGKRREIKRLMFGNKELSAAIRVHDSSHDNVQIRLFRACYATRSPLLTAIIYELLFKAKYTMRGLYPKLAKWLH